MLTLLAAPYFKGYVKRNSLKAADFSVRGM